MAGISIAMVATVVPLQYGVDVEIPGHWYRIAIWGIGGINRRGIVFFLLSSLFLLGEAGRERALNADCYPKRSLSFGPHW